MERGSISDHFISPAVSTLSSELIKWTASELAKFTPNELSKFGFTELTKSVTAVMK
jgi:hypothetical protein